jgi:hypothetical protein
LIGYSWPLLSRLVALLLNFLGFMVILDIITITATIIAISLGIVLILWRF